MVVGSIGLGYALPGAVLLKDDKGATETFKGMIEIGQDWVPAHIKVLSDKQLVNELVASVLGSATGMPVPRGYLVLVERRDFPDSTILQSRPSETGYAFACSTLSHPSLGRGIRLTSDALRLESLRNWSHWAAAIAFDDWIANWDRHDGNLLLGGPGEIWLIDHSHCFLKVDWSATDLQPDAPVTNQLCNQMCAAGLSDADKRAKMQQVHNALREFMCIDPVDAIASARAPPWLTADEIEGLGIFLTERPASIGVRIGAALGVPELPLEWKK